MVRHQYGFTIIEVVLFLAISSGLLLLLFAGTSIALQRQQYQDAIQSFATFLQGQYSAVTSVENDNEGTVTCPIADTRAFRGQSDCVIIGRYIAASDVEGRHYTAFPVYALQQGASWRYAYDENPDQSHEVSWGGKTRLAGRDKANVRLSMLMYRHPVTGQLAIKAADRTYSAADIGDLVNDQTKQGGAEVCVYDDGWLVNERRSVILAPRAGSSDAVTIMPASEACSD
ncbi:MAG: hypothetical protein Q4A34_02045 [Candidatus Saccharibacteria bacterium]|nr:hypothetical protein [Candidatus Saccharibacteria bacterium]